VQTLDSLPPTQQPDGFSARPPVRVFQVRQRLHAKLLSGPAAVISTLASARSSLRSRTQDRGAEVRVARPGDLRPVLPETAPDLRVAIWCEDILDAVGQRIAHAVALLLGSSVVVSKSPTR
jgi:hypothetical protein